MLGIGALGCGGHVQLSELVAGDTGMVVLVHAADSAVLAPVEFVFVSFQRRDGADRSVGSFVCAVVATAGMECADPALWASVSVVSAGWAPYWVGGSHRGKKQS